MADDMSRANAPFTLDQLAHRREAASSPAGTTGEPSTAVTPAKPNPTPAQVREVAAITLMVVLADARSSMDKATRDTDCCS